jgi:O-antigen/teichoic acid export membrane protein
MKEFEKNSIILLSLTMAGNIVNYFFQIVMGRMLDIGSFGILNSLLSFYTIVTIPVLVVLTVVAKYVSEYKALGMPVNILLKHFFSLVFVFSFFYTLLGICLSGFIASFINIENKILVSFFMAAAGFSLILYVAIGGLQGEKRFLAFGIVGLIFALTKLFGSIFFLTLGLELYGVVLSFLLGNILAIFAGLWLLKFNFKCYVEKTNFKIKLKTLQFVWFSILANVGIIILTNIDVILVKHFFTDEITGIYSAASILGKIILYIPAAIVMVMFPIAAEASAKKDNDGQILRKTLFYGGVFSLLCAAGLNIIAKQAVSIFFGNRYLESAVYILPVSLFFFALSFVYILVNYSLAVDRTRLLSYSLVIGCLTGFVLIYFNHTGILQIVYILAAISFGLIIMGIIALKKDIYTVEKNINNYPG